MISHDFRTEVNLGQFLEALGKAMQAAPAIGRLAIGEVGYARPERIDFAQGNTKSNIDLVLDAVQNVQNVVMSIQGDAIRFCNVLVRKLRIEADLLPAISSDGNGVIFFEKEDSINPDCLVESSKHG